MSMLHLFAYARAAAAFLFFTVLGLAALPAGEARAQSAMETFTLGKITVVALFDHPAAHDVKLFSGADPAVIAALAPSGLVESSVNAFLVQNGDTNILIDTGMGAGAGGELVHSLALLGLTPADIDVILLTHMHFDHIGGLARDGRPVYPNAALRIANAEQAFWLAPDAANLKGNPYIDFGPAKAAVAAYSGRLQGFDYGQEAAPGVLAVRAVGHTPGHTAYLVQSGGWKLLIWGDVTHAMALQMPHPEIYPAYDYDPVTATTTRQTILEQVSRDNIPVAGMHIPFPGVGRIQKDPNGGYSFTPGL